MALLAAAALPRADAPPRRCAARRSGSRWPAASTVAATAIGRAVVLSTFDTSHGDAVVGTIWDAFLGDLRLWGLVAGAVGADRRRGVRARRAAAPGGAVSARALAPRGAAGAARARRAALVVLAVLLLWMPEVPLDLALVSAAGLLVFTAAAEVVRISSAR